MLKTEMLRSKIIVLEKYYDTEIKKLKKEIKGLKK